MSKNKDGWEEDDRMAACLCIGFGYGSLLVLAVVAGNAKHYLLAFALLFLAVAGSFLAVVICSRLDTGFWPWQEGTRPEPRSREEIEAENRRLIKQLNADQRAFIKSRKSICDQWDMWEERARQAEASLDTLDREHTDALGQIKHLEPLALPGFTDIVKTALPS